MTEVPARFEAELHASAAPSAVVELVSDASAELVAAKQRCRATRAEVVELIATAARLDTISIGHAESAAALAAFEAEEAAAIRAWAATETDEPPPMPRTEMHKELAEAAKVAERRANAASAARQGVEAEIMRLNGSLAPLNDVIAAAALSVLAAEADPIVERTRATIKQLEADLADLGAITSIMVDEAKAAKEARSPSATAMTQASVGVIQKVEFAGVLMRMVGSPAAAQQKWRDVLADLKKENFDDE